MRKQIPDHFAGRAPRALERLAAMCLNAEAEDSRLGDLSERYVRTRECVSAYLGTTPLAMTLAHLMADVRYVFTTANVVMFSRAVDCGLRTAGTGTREIVALELKERAMTELHNAARKLVLPALLLVASAFLVNSAFNVWSTWRETEALIVDLHREKAEAAATQIDQYLAILEGQIDWATRSTVASASADQRRGDYLRLLRQVPAITEIAQLNGDGKEVLRISRLARDVADSGADFSSDARFAGALKRKKHVGAVYFDKQSEPFVSLAVAHAGSNPGVTLAEVNIERLREIVGAVNVGKTGYVYVVDADGRVIASRDRAQVLRETDLSSLPQVMAARSGNRGDRVTFDNNPAGAAVLSVHAAVSAVPWTVFVELPLAEARAPLWSALFRAICLLGLGLLAILLASFVTARRDMRASPTQGLEPSRAEF